MLITKYNCLVFFILLSSDIMKNIIYNYYGILVYDIKKYNNDYYFYYDDEKYLICLVLNDLEMVSNTYLYALKNNLDCFKIVKNNDNELFSKVDNKIYALLKISGILKFEYSVFDFNKLIIDKSGQNWGKLWSDRLDYYEIQVRELGIKYQTVLNTFGLYKGIAENAILYFNMSLKKFNDSDIVGIEHNRIKYPCFLIDYNNPINFVIDYSVRDVSEYIKSYMLSDSYSLDYVIKILKSFNFNKLMFNILYSRLLYPSFYFDIFDNIILEDGKDDDVVEVVNNYNRYLKMLKEIYSIFKDKYEMFKIEWLDKIKM